MGSKLKVSVKDGNGEYKELRPDHILNKALNGSDDEEKTIEIRGATLKDDFCNYSYEILQGPLLGPGTFNGSNIVHNDLKEAFKKLHPHLAVICEEINESEILDIEQIADFDDTIHSEGSIEHKVSHFYVSAFKVGSTGENENVVLVGSKRLSTGDFVELKSPKTSWQGQYPYINELRAAVDECRREVELYMNGKAAPKFKQTEMNFPEDGGGDDNQEDD